METKRKSYLSLQVIAILVIVTVLVVSVPLYFFVLKPFLNRGDSVEETKSDPLLEGETRSSSTLYIHSVEESDEQLYRLYNSEKGDWGFYVKGGNYALEGYESISYTYELYTVHSALKKTPGKHIMPSDDMLKELRAQKAEKMDAAELEKLGGINNLVLTEEDLKDVEIDYAEYGFEDFSKADRFTTVDADGVEHTLYLGNTTPDGDGRYAVYKGRKMVYRLDSTASTCVGASMLNVVAPIFTEVAQHTGYGLYIHAVLQGRGSEGMSQIMEPDVRESGVFQNFLMEVYHGVRVVHLSGKRRGKHIGAVWVFVMLLDQ